MYKTSSGIMIIRSSRVRVISSLSLSNPGKQKQGEHSGICSAGGCSLSSLRETSSARLHSVLVFIPCGALLHTRRGLEGAEQFWEKQANCKGCGRQSAAAWRLWLVLCCALGLCSLARHDLPGQQKGTIGYPLSGNGIFL